MLALTQRQQNVLEAWKGGLALMRGCRPARWRALCSRVKTFNDVRAPPDDLWPRCLRLRASKTDCQQRTKRSLEILILHIWVWAEEQQIKIKKKDFKNPRSPDVFQRLQNSFSCHSASPDTFKLSPSKHPPSTQISILPIQHPISHRLQLRPVLWALPQQWINT